MSSISSQAWLSWVQESRWQAKCRGMWSYPRIPEDFGTLAVQGISAINATYEPFGPSSYVEMATINLSSPKSARYYAIVYSNDTAGHYSLAVGTREEFSFSERITTPVRLISVYIWEGQSLGMILIPFLAAEIIGILIFWRGTRRTPFPLGGNSGRISLHGH